MLLSPILNLKISFDP